MNLIIDDNLPFAEKILALSKMMLQLIAEAAPPESVLYQRALKASLKLVTEVFNEVIKTEINGKN